MVASQVTVAIVLNITRLILTVLAILAIPDGLVIIAKVSYVIRIRTLLFPGVVRP